MKTKYLIIILIVVSLVLVIVPLIIFKNKKKKKFIKMISDLDYEKNQLIGVNILKELSKVRELIKNDILKQKLNEWDAILEDIKTNKINHLTDLITEADFLVDRKEYKEATKKIALIEMELEGGKKITSNMMDEIKVITESEDRNRNIITQLKVKYREIESKFENNIKDYGFLEDNIRSYFAGVDNLFKKFEVYMDKNDYVSVEEIVALLDKKISEMKVFIDEAPSLVLMSNVLIPGKIEELNTQYFRMQRDGYPLDYLNVEYNVKEIKDRTEKIKNDLLNFEINNASSELKTMLDYFNSIYNNFDKEKESKDIFKENIKKFKYKLDSINKIVYDIYIQMDDIKSNYDLSDTEINQFNELNRTLGKINDDYKILADHGKLKTFAYSKLVSELDGLSNKLTRLQDDLDYRLRSITSMKDDETRAREQYTLIQKILIESKKKLNEYNIPVIPNSYFIEFKEADEAIREIVKEINKKPIVIKILNVRVDTARDLVFKIYNKTNDMVKTVKVCEELIVYGNRYRSTYDEVDNKLDVATDLFNRGQYKKTLDLLINTLKEIDPGIIEKFKLKKE